MDDKGIVTRGNEVLSEEQLRQMSRHVKDIVPSATPAAEGIK